MNNENSIEVANKLTAIVYGTIALNTIEDNPKIFRNGVKRACSEIKKSAQMINCILARRINKRADENFIINFGCLLYGKIEAHITILQSCVANALARVGNTNSMFKARFLTAVYLCELACKYIDDNLKPQHRYVQYEDNKVIDLSQVLSPLRMTKILRHAITVERAVCETNDAIDVNLNNDNDVKSAIKVLNAKLADINLLTDVLCETEKLQQKQ